MSHNSHCNGSVVHPNRAPNRLLCKRKARLLRKRGLARALRKLIQQPGKGCHEQHDHVAMTLCEPIKRGNARLARRHNLDNYASVARNHTTPASFADLESCRRLNRTCHLVQKRPGQPHKLQRTTIQPWALNLWTFARAPGAAIVPTHDYAQPACSWTRITRASCANVYEWYHVPLRIRAKHTFGLKPERALRPNNRRKEDNEQQVGHRQRLPLHKNIGEIITKV